MSTQAKTKKRYTATTTGRVVNIQTREEVAKFECSSDGLRDAMAFASKLNEREV